MKTTIAVAVLAALAEAGVRLGGHHASNKTPPPAGGLPQCSIGCLTDALAKNGCSNIDFTCGCGMIPRIQNSATPCVVKHCGVDSAMHQVLPAVKEMCQDFEEAREKTRQRIKEEAKEEEEREEKVKERIKEAVAKARGDLILKGKCNVTEASKHFRV